MIENWMYKNISENFKWYEFFKSQVAERKEISNIPKEGYVYVNIKELVENVLQPIRDEFGPIVINSGYRSLKLNTVIGGSVMSNHCNGTAADIEPINPSVNYINIIEWIHNTISYRELIAEYFPTGWIHVAYREGENNRQLKLKDDVHNYERISISKLKELYG